jgi:hypothetical protein
MSDDTTTTAVTTTDADPPATPTHVVVAPGHRILHHHRHATGQVVASVSHAGETVAVSPGDADALVASGAATPAPSQPADSLD